MPKPIDPKKITLFDELVIREGANVKAAAIRSGVSLSWAYERVREMKLDGRLASRKHYKAMQMGGPIAYAALTAEAKRGWDDFEYFRRRYFGHLSEPWQVQAGETMVAAIESEIREYDVINCPPGGGKTTLLHDVAAWATTRNRSIRGLMGSGTQAKATRMLSRLRHSFERTMPERAQDEHIKMGLAVDAEATLTEDFGIFRPLNRDDPWRSDALMVVQKNFEITAEKEHTWAAYGLDVDYLGDRIDLIIWDDAVVPKDLTTVEKIETQRKNFDTLSETRLEPGGALFLVGQRIGANDLYAHCLDKIILPDDDDELDALEVADEQEAAVLHKRLDRKYTHIVYPAHNEANCQGLHDKTSPAWPTGCLLSPRRLPWKGAEGLRNIKYTNADTYEVWYQQKDTNPTDILVKNVWVNGGTDPDTGTLHWPAYDKTRRLCQLPGGLDGPLFSIATVDPSPTRYWGLQWWIVAPNASNQLFLMDLKKEKLRADEVLEWNANQGAFTGVMEEWQTRSEMLGWPIKTWIVENNGAQRFLLQYEFVRRWCAQHLTNIRPHTTTSRKSDPDYGVYTLREFWRHGRVRLPQGDEQSRLTSLKLADECMRYPHGWTDDQVMAMWFLTSHLEELTVQSSADITLNRPSWMQDYQDPREYLFAVR